MKDILIYIIIGLSILFPMWIGCIARLVFKKTRKQKLSFLISLPLTILTQLNSIDLYFQNETSEELKETEPLILIIMLLVTTFFMFAIYRVMANAGISLVELIKRKITSNQSIEPTSLNAGE